jgi:hypothetical protein
MRIDNYFAISLFAISLFFYRSLSEDLTSASSFRIALLANTKKTNEISGMYIPNS